MTLASLFAALTALSAQLEFRLGPVPYTMQNFAVVLSGLVLRPKYALLSQLLYLLLVAVGLPAATGLRGGPEVLVGYTAGYLWAFPLASFFMSLLSRSYARREPRILLSPSPRDRAVLLALSLVAALPIYVLGFVVFSYYVFQPSPLGKGLFAWSETVARRLGAAWSEPVLVVLLASVLVFVPQDLLVDHVLAIMLAPTVLRVLKEHGIEVP